MTKYPVEGGELVEYTPDSLANLPVPPKFFLRPMTERDRRRLRKLAIQEGLRNHDSDALRAETLRGLKELWSEEVYSEQEGRMRAFWEASDQYEKEIEGVEEPEPFDHPDLVWMLELSERVTRAWPPLLKMAADNDEYQSTWPKLIASLTLAGWRDIDVRYERVEGVVTLRCLDDLESKMAEIEDHAVADQIEGAIGRGAAFVQLVTRAIRMFGVNKDEEKNSASPSKSSTTPNTSKESGKEAKAGSSTAKNSTETLEA